MSKDLVREIRQREERLLPGGRRWEQVQGRLHALREILELVNFLQMAENEDLEAIGIVPDDEEWIPEQAANLFDTLVSFSESTKREIIRYFPIAIVACVEGYYKLAIADLIDYGAKNRSVPYFSNVGKLKVSFNIEMALQLHEHSISLGTYVSHQVKFNKFDELCSKMTLLIDRDFKELIREGRKQNIVQLRLPIFTEGEWAELDREEESKFFRDLKKIFYLRHIYAHELAPTVSLERIEEIKTCFLSSLDFLYASERVFGSILPPSTTPDVLS